MLKQQIAKSVFAGVIGAELVIIAVIGWVAAGMPGLAHDEGPPTITIDFAPAPAPASPVRAYRI